MAVDDMRSDNLEEGQVPQRWSMRLPATLKGVAVASEAIEQLLVSVDCPKKILRQVLVAADELLSNVANYAYEDDPGEMEVTAEIQDDTLQLTIEDDGQPFDPTRAAEPDTTLSIADRPIGGLGIFIVMRTMDEVLHKHVDGRNLLSIRKRLH